ncbi:folylpolyglutamate synthase/dihydrofolate synthase family protein [Metasolibacillus sp.]|uniref:bifunctional folylpolyglutamate synthase/dihydrofolate synthase n=1 Tax=Metasolibacillus sp. TaxID=2703680 RepID=UPI0025F27D9C|nr:folylpolyglutamate synthase/dihydrofolate synthase family protein [Metasolibacillus sp.]MCT6925457.1 bifunctional folylpolyglutamate synthase/dihydrofolate synthase [Metasolibacillus sp.]MCT6941713.1 bifunctional folylpolyglutamate synthase/dihydrofolate synthase [Metasolibacillus sp.]
MFQTMQQCTDFIFQLKASSYKGEPLEAMNKILAALGHPERKTKFIHFAGSNGKGSTLNATREILMAHDWTVGAFTSPHLERANERITINQQEISDEQFLRYANAVAQAVEEQLNGQFPSFFEVVTCIALQHFAEEEVDIALLETGIGGRLDATNVVIPEVSVITTISLEHTDLLGDTHALIAAEKAGIIKKGKPVVVGVEHPEARETIRQIAQQQEAPSYLLHESFQVERLANGAFHYKGDCSISNIQPAMEGIHQQNNAALAITASKLVLRELREEAVRVALHRAKWQGRFERFGTNLILDGAHNSEGTAALIQTLQQVEPNKKYHFLYAALQDKDHAVSIQMMEQVATALYFTTIQMPRAMSAQALAAQSPHSHIVEDWAKFLAEQQLAEDELLIITGSLYFIGEVRTFLTQRGVQ